MDANPLSEAELIEIVSREADLSAYTIHEMRGKEANVSQSHRLLLCGDIKRILAAERFFREAVKAADVCGEIGVPCPWCECRSYDANVEAVHTAACPYLLAQG